MAKLDFAFWDPIMGPIQNPTTSADVFDEHIRLAQRIEELGWHSYFTIEHQNNPGNLASSPSVYLAAVARETSKLRLGVMMWQLPFYNPMRLASEIATLDQLSRGRIEFGTGIGVHEHEFIRWGMNYYERAPISEEVLKVVKMAFTQHEVTFEGKYFKFDEALPEPKPYQQPYPPIWAAVHSDVSMEWAARQNLNVSQNLDTDEAVARKFDIFRRVWKECNHPGEMPRIFLQRSIFVAPTDEEAHEEARKYIGTSGGGRVGSGPIAETRVGWGSNQRGMGTDSDRPDDKARGVTMQQAGTSYEFNIENGLAIVGSPATVVKKLQEGQEKIGYDIFCTSCSIGRMPSDLVNRSIELIGKEVIPAFR
jgi:alkanesulfonate monooxygenase SsuD/methylene tetrahydromethanopterin reductase-like flavin-dependent oxidoreductase (luciferase family)